MNQTLDQLCLKVSKVAAKSRRRHLAAARKELREWREQEAQKQIEVDYRKWQHDQRMMWFRENDGTNQCLPAGGWAILLQRIASRSPELRVSLTAPRLRFC